MVSLRRLAEVLVLVAVLLLPGAGSLAQAQPAPLREALRTERRALPPESTEPTPLALAAAVLALPAAERDVETAVATLRERAETGPQHADEVAATLLLLDRNDDALEVLLAAGRSAEAFELLTGALRFDEALSLPFNEQSAAALTARARALQLLGRPDEAAALVASIAELRADSPAAAATEALRAAARLGLTDQAMAGALNLVGNGDVARSHELLPALWPNQRCESEAAWTFVTQQPGTKTAGDALLRVQDVLDTTRPSRDAELLIANGARLLDGLDRCAVERVGSGLVRIAEARGQQSAALAFARAWAGAAGTANAFAALGGQEALQGALAPAAASYGRAASLQPQEGAARWIQATMLRRMGQSDAAAPIADRAKDQTRQPDARLRLSQAMQSAGDAQDALQLRLELLSGEPADSQAAQGAAQFLVQTAAAPGALADVRQAFLAARQRAAAAALPLPRVLALVQQAQAAELAAMVAGDDLDGALALAAHALQPFVSGIDATADLVLALRAAGREEEASALLGTVAGQVESAVLSHGGSARLLNTHAWLLARTRTSLEAALDSAERAVALAPQHAGIADTLAEVRFQLGDRAGALEAERRALSLAPARANLQRQLERFATGDPATPPASLD